MRPKAEWAIDSEPIRARGIIVKYLLNFTGQVKSSCFVCGSGDHFLMAAPFLPSGQLNSTEEDCAIISTVVPNAAKTPAPSATAARSVTGITPPIKMMLPRKKLEARLTKSPQTTEVLQSYKPHTPINVLQLHNLLKSHPNQDFVNNLCTGLQYGLRVGYKVN